MKKSLLLFVVAIGFVGLTRTNAQITGFCFTDIFGYVADVSATRTGPGYWELSGTGDIGAGYDWAVSGNYTKETDTWTLTYTNTLPDGCTGYVDYFTYTSTSYGGGNINFNWTSYCFAAPLSSGTGSTTYSLGACPFRMGDGGQPIGPVSPNPELSSQSLGAMHSVEGGTIFGDLFEEDALSVINNGNNSFGINYDLVSDTKVTINIYNQLGQLVTTLVNGDHADGFYTTSWDASAANSGMYIVELRTDAGSVTAKFVH